MFFTILTPAYNRPDTLKRVFTSLAGQTFQDFEWLIVDDSTDNSVFDLVQSWLQNPPFAIRYIKQPNSGKHVAHNRGVLQARGKLCLILDDDDALPENALERFAFHWHSIPESSRDAFVGVTGLCVNRKTGKLLGGKFPKDVLDSDTITIEHIWGLGDDRQAVLRTDVLRQYLFPDFGGEKYITEGIIWNRIARTYKTRFVNEVLCIKEYGMTKSIIKHLSRSPNATLTYYQELLDAPFAFSLLKRLKFNAGYTRYALHAGRTMRRILKDGSRFWVYRLLGLIIGYGVFSIDEMRGMKHVPPVPPAAVSIAALQSEQIMEVTTSDNA